jgi:RNA polymerase sigma factor (sigma-70 family)
MLRVESVALMQQELVDRARTGDHEAFAQLAKTSFPRMYRTASLILRDSESAKDAVQDAYMQAWRHVRALRDSSSWDAWLHRTTVRACYKVARKEKRRTLVELREQPDSQGTGIPDASAGIAERDRLGRELDRLDIDQRTVIVLHFYLDLPLVDVAEILDIPAGTVKSRLHRGLERMRASMRGAPDALPQLDPEHSA